jgi:hypothetical protein
MPDAIALESTTIKMKTSAALASMLSATALIAQTNAPAPALEAAPKIQFKPYGWIKFDAVSDSARTSYGDIAFFVMPSSAPGGGESETTFSARDLRLGTHIIAPLQDGIAVRGRVEGDLCDDLAPNAYKPRLRLAFADIDLGDGWLVTAGQAWDTYCAIFPETLDPSNLGHAGNPYGRHPLARVTKNSALGGSSTLALKLAVQSGRNAADYDADGQSDENASGAPSFHASAVLQTKLLTDEPALFAISGAFGKETLNGAAPADDGAGGIDSAEYDSALLHFAAKLPLTERLAIQGVVFTGENLDNYLAGIAQGVNVAAGKEVSTTGGYINVIFKATPKLALSAGYGIDDPDDNDLAPAGARVKNDRAFANAAYKLTGQLSIWGEYSHMETTYAGGATERNDRVHLSAKYAF